MGRRSGLGERWIPSDQGYLAASGRRLLSVGGHAGYRARGGRARGWSFLVALTGSLVVSSTCTAAFAGATTSASVTVSASGYSPATVEVAQGGTVSWQFTDTSASQTVTGTPDLGLQLSSGPQPAGATWPPTPFAFNQAGGYRYTDQVTGQAGQVNVPVNVAPSSGATTSTALTVTWALTAPPAGDEFVAEVAFCASTPCTRSYTSLAGPTAALSTSFTPNQGAGYYYFRAKLKVKGARTASDWSPPVQVQVAVAPSITGFSPASGPTGTSVTVNGSGFTGATGVTVANEPASYTVVSDSQITAVVAATASGSGPITVTTPGGTATSTSAFSVTTSSGPTPLVVIVMENKAYSQIIGNPQAPFINTMIANGLLEQDYSAIKPGSGPNYLAMTSGTTSLTTAATSANIFADLGTSQSWRTFEESMPSACYPHSHSSTVVDGTTDPLYVIRHNPAMRYDNVAQTSLCKRVVPLDSTTFDPNNLPAFSYVVPNECNDMHSLPTDGKCPMWNGKTNTASNTITMGDNWLSQFVPAVAGNATVLLTWDESGSSGGEHIVTVLYGAGITPGTDSAAYNHYGLEAGLYAYYGLGTPPNAGASAKKLTIP